MQLSALAAAFHLSASAVRGTLRRPSYLVASVLILGVSIGAQMTMTAVIDATLVRPPSGRAPKELAFVQNNVPAGELSLADYTDIRDRATSFAGVFAFSTPRLVNLAIGDELHSAYCSPVSGNFFRVLGVQPGNGRLLAAEDDLPERPPVAVISAEFSRRFKLEVGSLLRVNASAFEVVGIIDSDYESLDKSVRSDFWIPLSHVTAFGKKSMLTNRVVQWLNVGARLGSGATFDTARAEIAAIGQQLQRDYPSSNEHMTLRLETLHAYRLGRDGSSKTMLLLFGLSWCLFALAFTNFFALTLLRLFGRKRELAVRVALGASRRDLGWLLVGELGLVCFAGLAVGYGLARAVLAALRLDAQVGALLQKSAVVVDLRVGLLVLVAVLMAAAVIWLLAMRTAGRVEVRAAFTESPTAPRAQKAFLALFAIQLALALFLAAVASSFLSSLGETLSRRLPFRTKNLLLLNVNARSAGKANQPGEKLAFVQDLLVKLRAVPGVTAAAASTSVPLAGGTWSHLTVDGRVPSESYDENFAWYSLVSPQIFETLDVKILAGRTIDEHDIATNAPVVVIDKAAWDRFWPGEVPLGKTVKPSPGSPALSVIGVVDRIPVSFDTRLRPRIYMPYSMWDDTAFVIQVAVQNDSRAVRDAINVALRGVWPFRNVPELRPMQDEVTRASADLASASRIILGVTGFATLIVGFGIYFLSAYAASQTVRDSAIRLAMGAETRHLFGAHLARYRHAILAGFVLGGAMIASAQPLWSALKLSSVSVHPLNAALALMVIGPIALVGLSLPLRQLLRVDIFVILRTETR
jgi:putative ABC transport system permease protein